MEGIETVGRAQEGNGPVDSGRVDGVTMQTDILAPALGRVAHCCRCSTIDNVGKASMMTYSRDMIDGRCISTKLGEM